MRQGSATGMIARRVLLKGSDRVAPEGATLVGDVEPDEKITVTVLVKRRTADKFTPGSAGDLARLLKPVTRQALAAQRRRTHARAGRPLRTSRCRPYDRLAERTPRRMEPSRVAS